MKFFQKATIVKKPRKRMPSNQDSSIDKPRPLRRRRRFVQFSDDQQQQSSLELHHSRHSSTASNPPSLQHLLNLQNVGQSREPLGRLQQESSDPQHPLNQQPFLSQNHTSLSQTSGKQTQELSARSSGAPSSSVVNHVAGPKKHLIHLPLLLSNSSVYSRSPASSSRMPSALFEKATILCNNL